MHIRRAFAGSLPPVKEASVVTTRNTEALCSPARPVDIGRRTWVSSLVDLIIACHETVYAPFCSRAATNYRAYGDCYWWQDFGSLGLRSECKGHTIYRNGENLLGHVTTLICPVYDSQPTDTPSLGTIFIKSPLSACHQFDYMAETWTSPRLMWWSEVPCDHTINVGHGAVMLQRLFRL